MFFFPIIFLGSKQLSQSNCDLDRSMLKICFEGFIVALALFILRKMRYCNVKVFYK